MERTVHGVTWKDPLAWMEDMKGKKWKDFIETEQEFWQSQVEKTKLSLRRQLESELEGYKTLQEAFVLGSQGIQVSMRGNSNICWKFDETKSEHQAANLDFCKEFPGFVWTVEEMEKSHGAEQYVLRCYVKERKDSVWKHQTPIAPSIAVVNGRIFCVEAKQKLVYFRVVSYNAFTGDDRKVHYEEHDKRFNLELIRCDCHTVYIRRQAGDKQDLLWFGSKEKEKGGICESSSLESRRFVLGNHRNCYFVWEQHYGWKMSKGLIKHGYKFPTMTRSMTPEALDCEKGLFVTKWKGERTLWRISKIKPAENLWQGIGAVGLDPYGGNMIRITQPGQEVIWFEGQIPKVKGYDMTYFDAPRGTRCIVVQPDKKPVGVLVTGYGAYGLPTSMSTARWEPLLKRGWIIVIGLWRGGGDHTPEWEDSGRRHGREAVLEDGKEVITLIQKRMDMKPSQTVVYGRSAGGLWVGGLVAKYPQGELFGGAYMEVPYLDVLRTTTNHTLPLTDIETDEFGLPSQRISDFVSMLKWSPMENIPAQGVKGVWQIVRTGLNDSEVYPYEAAKWVVRCGKKSYLAVEDGQGHFVSGSVGLKQQAEDLAVLLHLSSK
jgi:protease II